MSSSKMESEVLYAGWRTYRINLRELLLAIQEEAGQREWYRWYARHAPWPYRVAGQAVGLYVFVRLLGSMR